MNPSTVPKQCHKLTRLSTMTIQAYHPRKQRPVMEPGILEWKDLPMDVRTRIHRLAVIYSFPLRIYHWPDTPSTEPAITRILRLVRRESLPLFYNCNQFHIEIHDEKDGSAVRVWVNSLTNKTSGVSPPFTILLAHVRMGRDTCRTHATSA